MSFNQRYYEWQRECLKIINLKRREKNKKRLMVCVTVIHEWEKIQKRHYTKNRYWVAPLFKDRKLHGFYHAIFPNIIFEDSTFRNYFRMTATQLENLLQIIGPFLSKQTTSFREPISASERLCLTLRYVVINYNITIISNTLNAIEVTNDWYGSFCPSCSTFNV